MIKEELYLFLFKCIFLFTLVTITSICFSKDNTSAAEPRLDIKNWKNDALGCDETIYNFRKVLSNGFTNVVRIFKDQKNCFSFWDYQNSSWERNYGLLIDHFLVSPRMIERTKEFGIDSHIRGHEKPSDHVPVWINLNI